jgi:hypothetical protein
VFVGNQEKATEWLHALEDVGGEKGVAPEWIQAIHEALARLDPEAATHLPALTSSEE